MCLQKSRTAPCWTQHADEIDEHERTAAGLQHEADLQRAEQEACWEVPREERTRSLKIPGFVGHPRSRENAPGVHQGQEEAAAAVSIHAGVQEARLFGSSARLPPT